MLQCFAQPDQMIGFAVVSINSIHERGRSLILLSIKPTHFGQYASLWMDRQDLEKLIEAGKGRLITMDGAGACFRQPPVPPQQPPTYILCNSLPSGHPGEHSENCPPIVTSDWVLDSISNYELQSTARYYPDA